MKGRKHSHGRKVVGKREGLEKSKVWSSDARKENQKASRD